ncbi:MAG: hypothetical protein LBU14_03415 [Candidatus Peribacteria bacterium]|nr:hypothetical protein [Candidatus Peribacteria bacterium]
MKLTTTRNRILEKYDCKYVDIIKNTIEARVMQIQNPKCYSINRIIISENQLVVQNSSGSKVSEANPLTWPVNPIE